MSKTPWKISGFLTVLCLSYCLSGFAQWESSESESSGGGVESIVEPNLDAPQGMPAGYAPYYGQQYSPYPQAYAPPPQQPAARPWYRKIFSPITKRMSPPILQAKKIPKEPPRESKELKDPLIRLAKGITYEGTSVPPGFYLLGLQAGDSQTGATISITRQQKEILRVPAFTRASEATASTLPPPPDKTRKEGGNTPPEKVSDARVELSENGQSMILIYQQGNCQYTSAPLSVSESWLP